MNVATPAPFSAPVPIIVAPSMNVTVAVGVPVLDDGVTLAVNVTLAPGATADALALSSVVVDSTVTEISTDPELLARSLLSPHTSP